MVHFDNRAWRLLAKCEELAGFWPYLKKSTRLAVKIGFPVLLLSCTITVIIRCVREWNVNVHIAIEDALLAMLHFMVLAKFCVCVVGKRRREIFDRVASHFETIVDEDEAAILRRYSNAALTFTIKYIVCIGITFGSYDISPVAKMCFDYFFGDGTLEKKLPFYVDYLVDEQEYFYYILAHLSMVVFTCVVVELAFVLSFFLTVRHACALFEIVKLRLKKVSEIFQQCDPNNVLSDSDEHEAYEILLSTVDLHNKALKLIQSIDELYRICLFIILLLNAATLAPLPVLVTIYLHDPFELVRHALLLVTSLAHLYIVFFHGQLTIDHSSSIFNACYDFCWYNAPKKCRVVVSVMMRQSLKPSRLTGGSVFNLSMETYSKMLKTALSYISMFAAIDTTIDLNK